MTLVRDIKADFIKDNYYNGFCSRREGLGSAANTRTRGISRRGAGGGDQWVKNH